MGSVCRCLCNFTRPLNPWRYGARPAAFFVISHESPAVLLSSRSGFMAPGALYKNVSAIKITGAPCKTSADAEDACNTVLVHLTSERM